MAQDNGGGAGVGIRSYQPKRTVQILGGASEVALALEIDLADVGQRRCLAREVADTVLDGDRAIESPQCGIGRLRVGAPVTGWR